MQRGHPGTIMGNEGGGIGKDLRACMIAADNKIGNSPPPQWLAKTRIVLGTAGADGGARDSIVVVDAATGKVAWRKYVIPAPGEPGRDTWKDKNAWETDGGDTLQRVIYFLPVTDDVLDLLCEAGRRGSI